jgi:hypothetical protein
MPVAEKSPWIRVTKKNPCPVCQHPDWCCIGEVFINCMRVESQTPAKNGGWLHRLGADIPKPRYIPKPAPVPKINAHALWKSYLANTTPLRVKELADNLGVSVYALNLLGCAWAGGFRAWAIPCRRPDGAVTGIQLRYPDGQKRCVPGSHAALFLPDLADFQSIDPLYCAEGASDVAALLTMGFPAIGRWQCKGQHDLVNEYIARNRIRRVIIVSDTKDIEIDGAEALQKALRVPSLLWLPPARDVRAFLNAGGTAAMIRSACRDLIWQQPRRAEVTA